MSIYPVRLSEWFPAKPTRMWAAPYEQRLWHKNAKECVASATCRRCGKKPTWRYAWGMHSIPWGYGWDDVWCSKKCLEAKDRK